MAFVLIAVVWKNLLLRRNHWLQTLSEMLVPLLLLLLINYFWMPIKFPKRVERELLYFIDSPPHSILLYSPNDAATRTFMLAFGEKAGYESINTRPTDLENVNEPFHIAILMTEQNKSMANYVIYTGVRSPPLPIWFQNIGKEMGLEAVIDLASIQNLIDSVLINSTSEVMPKIILKNMDSFKDEPNFYGLIIFTAVLFALSFLVSPVITRVVEEKESGAKELMRMMGVSRFQLWTAKLIDAMMIVFFVGVGMTILLAVPITKTSMVVQYVNPLYFFMIFTIGMLAVVISLFALSCCFENPSYAGMVAGTLISASILSLLIAKVVPIGWSTKMLLCLMPHVALLIAFQNLLKLEHFQKPFNWTERLSADDSALSFCDISVIIIIDILIYSLLTWYLDNVRPGQYGVPQSLTFFLKPSYWSPSKIVSEDGVPMIDGNKGSDSGVWVNQLRKVYKVSGRAPVVAVDGVDLDIPKGCIYALLGHNGAGKSTTMNIITGLIPPTSGTVLINGHNLRLNPDEARQSVGLCPQKDFLFRDLTAIQTLIFYGLIKGMTYRNAREEAKDLLKTMKMGHAENRKSQSLSGGMKRKLCLGIAMIGKSQVLILDEPTSGVDPALRREICDMLLSHRGERTILLTTHIMEEADAISDYIYIMDHGKVQCSGSPIDLKTRFGTGYTLQIVIQNAEQEMIIDTVLESVDNSMFKARNAATLIFQLPSVEMSSFPYLFQQLDDMQGNKEIASYSVSISTLEDVFVRIREVNKNDRKQNSDEVDGTQNQVLASNTELNFTKYEGCQLILRQLYAQLIKKYLVFIRCYRRFIVFVSIPLAIVLFSDVIAPKLTKMVEMDKPDFTFFNYSSPMYDGMKIFYSKSLSCPFCETYEKSLQKVTNERGFTLKEVSNISNAANKEFLKDFHQYSRYLALGFAISSENIILYYNSEAVHIINIGINILNKAWLLQYGPSDINAALNLSLAKKDFIPDNIKLSTDSKFPDMFGLQTLYYMSGVQTEKIKGAKSLQLLVVSGSLYWLPHIIFDMGTFSVYAIVAGVVQYIIKPDDPIFKTEFDLVPAILLWGAGMILISYLVCFYTRTEANAISLALFIYFVFSFFAGQLVSAHILPKWVQYLHPTTIWKFGIASTSDRYLISLTKYALVLFILLVSSESPLSDRIGHKLLTIISKTNYSCPGETDPDVAKEARLVSELSKNPTSVPNTLLASDLKRRYGLINVHAAVKGVSFRVVPGECFGLLGVNGAGKSSTFNMLTGQIACSGGDVYLNDSRVSALNQDEYLSQVGYCPQASGIIPDLEGREFLELFCRLRGYREGEIAETTKKWIKILDLEECAGKQCGRYSGGMERKLSAAAAFLWDANIVLLDEPTSGVDPVARRSIWKAVTTAQKNGKSVLLTSHSMDECDALCSRLAIMVDGHFKCLGETTTIKKKYGGGFSIQLKLSNASPDDLAKFQAAVKKTFGHGCHLTDVHSSILHYEIKDKKTTWKKLFQKLERLKANFPILESYMASETTLEQIFLSFASTRRTKDAENIV